MLDFVKYKYVSISISLILILIGFGITFGVHGGFAHSLDFNGGIRTTINFPDGMSREKLNAYFQERDMEAVIIELDKEKSIWQIDTGLSVLDDYKLKRKEAGKDQGSAVDDFIGSIVNDFNLSNEDVMSADQVGAVVGGELTETGISLVLWTVVVMTAYLTFRFRFFKYSVGASLALMHDLFLALAFVGAFQIKPSVPLIAAILTLLGYSINDTIVVFDRIRENTQNDPDLTITSVINNSIFQTLGRTINTSFATLIAVVAIVVGGAVELFDFAYVLIFGVVVGTYSSIFIAAPIIEIYDEFTRKRRSKVQA